MEEKFLTLSEAAVFLKMGRSRLYEAYEQGLVPSHPNGEGKILFRMSDLEKVLTPRITTKKGAQ
jgi:predicted DNA-binding transcriptional regulator AlpA